MNMNTTFWMMDYDLLEFLLLIFVIQIDNDRLINWGGWLLTEAIRVVILYACSFKSLQ